MAKRVMIADDSDASRDSLSFALLQKGYEVLTASDGRDALSKLKGEKGIDLIITDINMPNMTGLELIKNLRALEAYRFTPIIVLSSEKEEIKKSTEAGASAWIAKSSKMSEQLVETIKKLIPS
jgi:two-component system, chemotaxis family, chemotaxis protein CheY